MVEGQSLGVGVEEGAPFQVEEVAEEDPCPVVEEVGVEVQNRAGEEVVVEVQNLVEEEGEAVVDKIQVQVGAGEVVVEEEQYPLVMVAAVVVVAVEVEAYLQRWEGEVEVGVEELDGRCSVASAGTCRQSSL